jgi:colanic acid biosynthesis protein WcaH
MLMVQVENSNQVPETNPWLSEEVFSTACAAIPLVSVDLMVTRPGQQGRELLLGLRNNRPAQGWWFTPGGRIRKNEALASAMRRVAQDEIGLDPESLGRAQMLGAWDHFYPDSAFDANISTHYVNLPYAVHLCGDEAQTLKLPIWNGSQHLEWRWIPITEAQNNERVHAYVRAVLGRLLEL